MRWDRVLRLWGTILVLWMPAGCLDRSGQAPVKADKASAQDLSKPAPGPTRQELPKAFGPPSEQWGAALPPVKPPGNVRTEPITGYKTPAEYLLIPGDRYPGAVVAVSLPLDYAKRPGKSYPLLIAFGGAGECARTNPRDGSLAWLHYYRADEAEAALTRNVLHEGDFRHLATKAEINSFNRRLAARTYGGVILVCPSSPPLLSPPELEDPGYEVFIVKDLVPELLRRYRVMPRGMGVDGVSMGGARAMYYALKYPDLFFSIGSSQGAFRPFMPKYKELIDKNRDMLRDRPIQLVTSDKDPLAPSVRAMKDMLETEGVPVSFLNLTGPHDYIFNQGPGALSMLLFHSHAMRKRPSGPVR